MAKLNAYLNFPGSCRDAMTFYNECLGGKLEISNVGDSPVAANMPSDAKNNVMHSSLVGEEWVIMAADFMDMSAAPAKGNMLNLCLQFDTKAEAISMFEKLSAGGKIDMPIRSEFFGTFGAFTDKFNIPWAIQSDEK